VFAGHIEDLLLFGTLQRLSARIELFRFRRARQVACVKDKVGLRIQRIDSIDRHL
jgi:hypothetical protein